MNIDVIILVSAWIITIVLLIIFIPRDKFREASVIFLSKQFITWISGTLVAELNLIIYPVRSFANAYKGNFDFEYFIYPSICVLFNLSFPEDKSKLRRLLYYIYYCSVMTLIEVLVEKYTEIIHYIHWNWYVTWVTLFITFFITRQYYRWFFKLKHKN